LDDLLTSNYTVFVFPLDFALGNARTCDGYHLGLLRPWVLHFENLSDLGGSQNLNVNCMAFFFLDLSTNIMHIVLNILNVLVDKLVLMYADTL